MTGIDIENAALNRAATEYSGDAVPDAPWIVRMFCRAWFRDQLYQCYYQGWIDARTFVRAQKKGRP